MSTLWNTKAISKAGSGAELSDQLSADEVVILLQGKNNFGDRIFSYLKLTLQDMMRMQTAVLSGQPFNPSDFGTVVAAGKGEPTDEVKSEISALYRIIDPNQMAPAAPAAPPVQQKAWDDF